MQLNYVVFTASTTVKCELSLTSGLYWHSYWTWKLRWYLESYNVILCFCWKKTRSACCQASVLTLAVTQPQDRINMDVPILESTYKTSKVQHWGGWKSKIHLLTVMTICFLRRIFHYFWMHSAFIWQTKLPSTLLLFSCDMLTACKERLPLHHAFLHGHLLFQQNIPILKLENQTPPLNGPDNENGLTKLFWSKSQRYKRQRK